MGRDKDSDGKPRYRKEDSKRLAADVAYAVTRVEVLAKVPSAETSHSAPERALPRQIIRRHNRGGCLGLRDVINELK